MTRAIALFAATLLCSTAALADDDIPPVVGGRTYVQHQVMAAKVRHPGITSIVVEGKRDKAGDNVVVLGSTLGAASVFRPVAHPDATVGGSVAADGRHYVSRQRFDSSTGHRLGTLVVTFPYRRGRATAPLDATAQGIAADMARVTLSAKNAVDPYPYDPHYAAATYAQALTTRMVAKYPDLLVMMIHATPPAGGRNVIIGSNIGRIGKIADEDDLRVIEKGSTNLEVGGDDDRFETELPLNDASGTRIGALGLVFAYAKTADKDAIHAHGRAIRDELATQIPSSAALFKPAR